MNAQLLLLQITVIATVSLFACAPASSTSSPSPASRSAPTGAGQSEWSQLLAAAKQEGKVAVAGPPGDSFRQAALAFQQTYPDIAVEFTGGTTENILPKLLAERRADSYLWDIFLGGGQSGAILKDQGALDPLTPALLLPDVASDSKWLGGFSDGYMDVDKTYIYAFSGFMFQNVLVNRQVIPESELNSVEQLFDPKWKGLMTWNDPRVPGAGSYLAAYFLALTDEGWLRRLLEQDVVAVKDIRQQVEWLVRGRYPIALGPDAIVVTEFRRQGFEAELSPITATDPLATRLVTGFGQAMLANRAPHPNAARVYLNWLLSQEGQTTWVAASDQNSRRLDVSGPQTTAATPGVNYLNISKEENAAYYTRALELAKTMLP